MAVVTNAGGAGVLAADACGDNGLGVPALSAATRRRLASLLPPGAAVTNPVDTTAAVSQDAFRACLEEVAADEGIDAVLAVIAPTALADLGQALCAARVAKPLAAAVLDQRETVRLLASDERQGSRAAVPAAIPATRSPRARPGRWGMPPPTTPGADGSAGRSPNSAGCAPRTPGRASRPSPCAP